MDAVLDDADLVNEIFKRIADDDPNVEARALANWRAINKIVRAATEADARVGALLQENARLKREARIVAEERDSAVDSLERVTQKYNDLKRMRNIKRVTFVGGA